MPRRCQIDVDDCSCRHQQSSQRDTHNVEIASLKRETCSGILLSGGDLEAEAAEAPHHSTLLDTVDSIEDRSAVLRSEAFSDISDLSVRDVSMRAADALRYISGTASNLITTQPLAQGGARAEMFCAHPAFSSAQNLAKKADWLRLKTYKTPE